MKTVFFEVVSLLETVSLELEYVAVDGDQRVRVFDVEVSRASLMLDE